ncbi:MAG TPA: hypothetical protein VGA78_02490 [Gemmatimonadales bacterium]
MPTPEESLEEQREWLRVTLSSIGDAVVTTDTSGQVTFLNPVGERARKAGFDFHLVKPLDPDQLQQYLVGEGDPALPPFAETS